MFEAIHSFLVGNITVAGASTLIGALQLLLVAICAVVSYYVIEGCLEIVRLIVKRSPSTWDDDLLTSRVLKAVSQLAPAIVVSWMIPGFFADNPESVRWLTALTSLYIVWAAVRVITIFIGTLYEALAKRPSMKPYAIKGIFQMLKLIVISIGVIIALSILINRSPMVIITALGASAAVLMLVFKDTILGLVASVQLTANNMVHRGDWIIADKFDINGEVIDVSLTTVKVQNWDKSISTIPPYSLVSDSFRNYQPMFICGGRRVCRSILIDANTVRFCTPDEIADIAKEGWLEGLDVDQATRVVNLNLLRRYLEYYLATDSRVNTDMMHMVRQLEPTPSGLPLQLYFFTKTTVWKEYETHQADIFDHIYAVVRRFGLAMYQIPSGREISNLNQK